MHDDDELGNEGTQPEQKPRAPPSKVEPSASKPSGSKKRPSAGSDDSIISPLVKCLRHNDDCDYIPLECKCDIISPDIMTKLLTKRGDALRNSLFAIGKAYCTKIEKLPKDHSKLMKTAKDAIRTRLNKPDKFMLVSGL